MPTPFPAPIGANTAIMPSRLKRKKERPRRPTMGPCPLRTPASIISQDVAKRADPSCPGRRRRSRARMPNQSIRRTRRASFQTMIANKRRRRSTAIISVNVPHQSARHEAQSSLLNRLVQKPGTSNPIGAMSYVGWTYCTSSRCFSSSWPLERLTSNRARKLIPSRPSIPSPYGSR